MQCSLQNIQQSISELKEKIFSAEQNMHQSTIIQEKLRHEEQTGRLLEPRVNSPKEEKQQDIEAILIEIQVK